jgi:hypothetical protein
VSTTFPRACRGHPLQSERHDRAWQIGHDAPPVVRCVVASGGQALQRLAAAPMRVRMPEGKYSIELFKEGGEGAGLEAILDRHDDLTIARAIYRGRVEQFPGRLIMLCDRARPSSENSVCDESVDNPDYHDSR